MSHGGSRPGSGRKSNAELRSIRSAVDRIITPAEWHDLFRNLYTHAKEGNIRAAQLLLNYRYGDPYADPPAEQTADVQQIGFVEYLSPHQPSYPFEKIRHPDGNTYYIPLDPKTLARLPESLRQQPPVPYDADEFPAGPPPAPPSFPQDDHPSASQPQPSPEPLSRRKRKRKRSKRHARQDPPSPIDLSDLSP